MNTNKLPIYKQILAVPLLYALMLLKILIAIPTSVIMLCNTIIQKASHHEKSQ